MRMRALTIRQPWASLIVHGEKDVENRSWGPPASLLAEDADDFAPARQGQPLFAVHAGMGVDVDALAEHWSLLQRIGVVGRNVGEPDVAALPRGGVVGVARVAGLVVPGAALHRGAFGLAGAPTRYVESRWFTGERGWALFDACATQLVPCRGVLGLWTLPPDVERAVCAQLRRAR